MRLIRRGTKTASLVAARYNHNSNGESSRHSASVAPSQPLVPFVPGILVFSWDLAVDDVIVPIHASTEYTASTVLCRLRALYGVLLAKIYLKSPRYGSLSHLQIANRTSPDFISNYVVPLHTASHSNCYHIILQPTAIRGCAADDEGGGGALVT